MITHREIVCTIRVEMISYEGKTQTFLPSSIQQALVQRLRLDEKLAFTMLVPGLSRSSKSRATYASELNTKLMRPRSVTEPPFSFPSSKVTSDA